MSQVWSLDRWSALLDRLGANRAQEKIFEKMEFRYTERHRAYHNTTHIVDCLNLLDEHRDLAEEADCVEAALWLHDVVYKTRSTTNEEDSANWASRHLRKSGVNDDFIGSIEKLIMITRHAETPDIIDEKLIVDIDLSILGRPLRIFEEYEQNIRKEYRWVPGLLYRRKRKEILRSFLERERIYQLPEFADKFEEQARTNLKNLIIQL